VFDYMRQFNTLAQYGSYHIDMDEKKVNLYHAGLIIQLQDQLVQYPNVSYNDLASAAIDQERTMKAVVEAEEKKRKRMMPRSSGSGTAWCIPHLGVSCTILNCSSIGAITRNTHSDTSSRNSSSSSHSNSIVLRLQCHSMLQPVRHSRLPPTTFHATTAGSWVTSPASASCPIKENCHELWHPWLTSRGANRGVLHHGLAVPTTLPWMRSPWEKKC
jgi:hypothetical protein